MALFEFIRNGIDFQPYFGSVKGSQGALLDKAGNDMDQASLLIALLRASNVPARYVAGVVEMPVEKAMNWVGVNTPAAAANFAAASALLAEGGAAAVVVAGGLIALGIGLVALSAFVVYKSWGGILALGGRGALDRRRRRVAYA